MKLRTQTNEPTYADTRQTTRPQLEHTATPDWSEALTTVEEFRYQPDFINALQLEGIDPTDQTSSAYATMLSYYSEAYLANSSDILDVNESTKVTLLASAPSILHVQQELSQLQNSERSLTDEEKYRLHNDLKPAAIWYNKRLSDYFSSNGREKFADIVRALTEASVDFFPDDDTDVQYSLMQLARGARNESSADILRATLPEYFRETTIKEDGQSADQMLTYKGIEYNIDLKSSTYRVKELYLQRLRLTGASQEEITATFQKIDDGFLNYATYRHPNSSRSTIILYTGIKDEDYNGYNQLASTTLEEKSFAMQVQLQRAVNELIA